jgi:hypothetical protein
MPNIMELICDLIEAYAGVVASEHGVVRHAQIARF